MTFKFNLLTLALITACNGAWAQTETTEKVQGKTSNAINKVSAKKSPKVSEKPKVNSYQLANANTSKVKFARWQCKRCTTTESATGNVEVGLGYSDAKDNHAANQLNTQDGMAYQVSAQGKYTNEQYQAQINANNLGMDNSRLDISAAKLGEYQGEFNYRTIKSYTTDKALTPYQGVGSNHLTLPSDWVQGGTTSDMTNLYGSLTETELSLKRERFAMGFSYHPENWWSSEIDYQRETKTGLKAASGSFFNQSIMLAEPVDHTTDTFNAGLSFKGQHWFSSISYSGSRFKNQYNELIFDNAFTPTFGAQTFGVMALSPNNQSHTVSLAGNYNNGTNAISGRLYLGQMEQDQSLVTLGYIHPTPQSSAQAKVDLTGFNLRANHKYNRDLRLSASYDYSDRDNKTPIHEWTQISIDNTTAKISLNTPYDQTRHTVKLGANYRLSSDIRLSGGYDVKRTERNYQHREVTNDNELWGRINYTGIDNWRFQAKYSLNLRDGSHYETSSITSDENNPLLRRYNLADRQRNQVQLSITNTSIDDVVINLNGRYANDDYDKSEIGLTSAKDLGYDINLHYLLTSDISVNGFYSWQQIDSKQNGSSQFGKPNWFSEIQDKFHYLGAGVRYDNLLQDKLGLGLDYYYSKSDSTTQVTKGVTGNYGDYFDRSHNLEIFANYAATEQVSLRMDYKYQRYQDNDPANSLAVDDIWNVLSFGDLNHNYNAHLVMFSIKYSI